MARKKTILKKETPGLFERVRERAYEIFLSRDPHTPGNADADWLRAEKEITEKDEPSKK